MERVGGERGRICERVLDTILLGGREVARRCEGNVRRLYVREVAGGKAKGWRVVGTVCLLCHDVRLHSEWLPERQPTDRERHEMWWERYQRAQRESLEARERLRAQEQQQSASAGSSPL